MLIDCLFLGSSRAVGTVQYYNPHENQSLPLTIDQSQPGNVN